MEANIIPYGDQAILVNFEQKIDIDVNQRVHALKRVLEQSCHKSITFMIPAYCSLTIGYDQNICNFPKLKKIIQASIPKIKLKSKMANYLKEVVEIPVCYDKTFGLDLADLSKDLKLSIENIIDLHTEQEYYVYMIGFLPGFPYMGPLDKRLHTKRRGNPRIQVPQNSVAIAGNQTGIYPQRSPGGWHIIGRTPLSLFNPDFTPIIQAGQWIKCKRIDLIEYEKIRTTYTMNEHE